MIISNIIELLAQKNFVSENDINFCNRVWNTDTSLYERRLKGLGFFDKNVILDAGFGMMQWSYVLSKLNNKVYGIEFNEERYKFACELKEKLNIQNFYPFRGSIENMSFDDNLFDGIFSYSVIMLTDYRKSNMRILIMISCCEIHSDYTL